ncbi:MAG: hypothetical protein WCO45_01405 [Pseudanabaena sp. ELA607]
MQPHQFSDSRKNRIYNKLNALVGRGASAFYRDACRLMEIEMPLESTTHLVGHLLRETMSSLLAVLVPLLEVTGENKSKRNSYERKIIAALNKLEIPETSDVAKIWLYLANEKSEYALNKLAHRNSLQPPRVTSEEFAIFWEEIQMLLDGVLERFETVTAEIRIKLDSLMSKALPTDDDIDFLRQGIPNSSFALGYFFENLKHPEWLNPLQEKGFFNHPPDIEIDPEGKTFRFYVWEQSRYLRRVASDKPDEVLEIGMQLFDRDCKNILIYEDMAEAALKMSPEQSARWVERATQWLKKQDPFPVYRSFPEILGKLINYLSSKNQVDVAINLARELLAILPSSSEPDNILSREPIIRFEEYHYSKIINENVLIILNSQSTAVLMTFYNLLGKYLCHSLEINQDLINLLAVSIWVVSKQTDAVLTMFCGLLDKCLRPPFVINQDVITEDYSYVWYPNLDIASGDQYDIKKLLTTTIWKITKQLLEIDSSKAKSLCKKFQSYRWRVFDRIAIHVMQHFPEQTQDLIVECLLDRKRLNYHPKELVYSQEYSKLLQISFSKLDELQRNQILLWLLDEPLNINEVDAQRVEVYVKYWRKNWLSIIKDWLSPELSQLYSQLDEELNLIVDSKNINPPKSEAEMIELAEKDINELLKHFKECPKSHNNLSWALVITPYAQKFVNEIERFKELDLQFMISLFRGLEEALKTQKTELSAFLWNPVFDFCTWILDNFKEIYNHEFSNEWNRLCESMVSLIDSGLHTKAPNQIPMTLRDQVWQILTYLTNAPYVTPSFTTHYHGSSQGAYGASINTVRGQAMHAVIPYIQWIRQDADGNVPMAQNFQDMPEVQQVLEQHLDPQKDPSLAIRSVYGQWFPNLYHLASDWTFQQTDRIFPEEPDYQELFDSAWQGYILRNRVYSNIFSVLREKYGHVIEQLPNQTSTSREQSEANVALSSHLLDLFWVKVIDLDEPDKLIEKFFANAPVYTRSEFIHKIGWRLLYGTREPHNIQITQELGQRLQKLLDWRISKIQEDKLPIEQIADLKYFSWWFASGKLDNQWAITKLIEVLSLVETVEYCEGFLEYLEYLASEMSQEAVQCLSLLANGSSAIEWFRSYGGSHFAAILRSAMESGDEVSKKKAKELINQLVARDLVDCRELLLTPK